MKLKIKHLLYKTFLGMIFYRSIQQIIDLFRLKIKIQSHHGFRFVGNKRFLDPNQEKHIVDYIYTNYSNFSLLVNVGANHGFYPLITSQLGLESLAIEPEKRNLRFLRENIRINKFHNSIKIIPSALTSKSGGVTLYGDGETGSILADMPYNIEIDKKQVESISIHELNVFIEQYKDKRPLLFIIDVEGAELDLIPSMEEFIQRQNAVYIIEILISLIKENRFYTIEKIQKVFKIFLENGFTCLEMKSNRTLNSNNTDELFKIMPDGHDFLFFR